MLEISAKNRKYLSWLLKIKKITSNDGMNIAKRSIFMADTQIGRGTRINGKILVKGEGKCVIKNYCAFGSDIKIITTNHDMTFMNLQLALQSRLGAKRGFAERKNVTIGHNVWIGDSTIILAGVEIGNGAVIGAGSIVTKNVPSYAIVAGNPAKIIRYRFDEEKMNEIENYEWWDWSFEKMKENISIFNTKVKECR